LVQAPGEPFDGFRRGALEVEQPGPFRGDGAGLIGRPRNESFSAQTLHWRPNQGVRQSIGRRADHAQAHERGLRVFGGTITPFGGSIIDSVTAGQTRDAVNHWIMTSRAFDGVIDFAGAVADPANPSVLRPAYDSGDHLHPNDAGGQAMATAVNPGLLLR
jgi:hypothetical protein